jgi:hypothetical protein
MSSFSVTIPSHVAVSAQAQSSLRTANEQAGANEVVGSSRKNRKSEDSDRSGDVSSTLAFNAAVSSIPRGKAADVSVAVNTSASGTTATASVNTYTASGTSGIKEKTGRNVDTVA